MNACFRIFASWLIHALTTSNFKDTSLYAYHYLFFLKLNVLYVSHFSSVINTRETQCMLLIDPDGDEEEHDRNYKKV